MLPLPLPLALLLIASDAKVIEAPLDPDVAVERALANARSLIVERAQLDRARHAAATIGLNDVRVGLDHFGVAQLVAPDADAQGVDVLDNAQVALSWRPPRPEQFGLAQAIAVARVDVDAVRVESAVRAIAAETRLLHAHILLLRDERKVVESTLRVLKNAHEIVAAKLRSNVATQVEVSLAAMDVLDMEIDVDEIDARIARAEARFSRLVGLDEGGAQVLLLGGAVPPCQPPPEAELMLSLARERSPKLRALALERAALELESTRRSLRPVPWIDRVRAGYLSHRPFDGRDELHIGIDVDVPVFALLDGFADESIDLRRIKLDAEVLEAEDDVESAVAAAVLRQRTAAALFAEHAQATATIVADSTNAVDAALASGGADALGAATVHARALKSRRASLRAHERCVEAVIDLWRTTGDVVNPRTAVRTPPGSR